jgi:hypothetical protein
MRSSRFSFRSRANSSRSSFISPLFPRVRSARACVTQCASADAVRSNSASHCADRLAFIQDEADGAALELFRELPPGSSAQCVFRHAGHRIHLSEDVHGIGSSAVVTSELRWGNPIEPRTRVLAKRVNDLDVAADGGRGVVATH